jgi:hypothetical protein
LPAILKGHVHFNLAKVDESDVLFRVSELTTREAAELAGCTLERVRQLVERHKVGRWIERLQCYAIDRQKLLDHMARKKRRRSLA